MFETRSLPDRPDVVAPDGSAGRGRMWRAHHDRVGVVGLAPGVALTIPLGTHFQFRADGDGALSVLGVTMAPWPGDGEAVRSDRGPWAPTVAPGPGLAEA